MNVDKKIGATEEELFHRIASDDEVLHRFVKHLDDRKAAARERAKKLPPPHPFALEVTPMSDPTGTPMPMPNLTEVIPGVFVSQKVIDDVTKGTAPRLMHENKYWKDIKDDVAIGRQIAESLEKTASIRVMLKAETDLALERATVIEQDRRIAFIDVTDRPPVAAAKRIINATQSHSGWEVEPIDLTGVLDDVKPLREVTVDEVTYVIKCAYPQADDDMPNRMMFAVPEATDNESKTTLHTYVRLGALPKEVQTVVKTCLVLTGNETFPRQKWNKSMGHSTMYDRLCLEIEALRAKSLEFLPHGMPLHPIETK